MSTIVFAMLPEAGHLYTSFGLAEKLRSRGHRIIYIGLPESEDVTRSKGFEFVRILGGLSSLIGTPDRSAGTDSVLRPGFFESIDRMRRLNQQFFGYLFTSEIDALFSDLAPDLMIVDSALPFFSLCAYRNGIKSICISVTLQERNLRIPPLTTSIVPRGDLISRLIVLWSWRWIFLRSFFSRNLFRLFGIDTDYVRLLKKLAQTADYPTEKINSITTLMPSTGLPEMILCPQNFDYPRENTGCLKYIEPSITIEESEIPFPWRRIDQNKSLIFCAFGSQSDLYDKHQEVFQTLINAIGKRSDLQLVIALGEKIDIHSFQNPFSNVVLVNWAPYRSLLGKSSIMINHGGLGSIKHCIYFSVPLIVIPFGRDQPGNAARVDYHGIGLAADPNKVSESYLGTLINAIQEDPSYRTRINRMSQKFREIEEANDGVKVIERYSNFTLDEYRNWVQ
ncbi:MAG: glycosyltransferase [Chloroflexota bacterium]|nr:glycosyltransferase [Chloroflexota bacterium]